MKKALFLIILTVIAVYSFAQGEVNRSIFIEGDAPDYEILGFFYSNFRQEALGAGYTVANEIKNAGFIFRFDVNWNPYFEYDGNQYELKISLFNTLNKREPEVLSFNFYFDDISQMNEHTNYLFYRAVSVIPPVTEDALVYEQTWWKYKWIYLRASFDYPVSFYELRQSNDLYKKIALYDGDIDNPSKFMNLRNIIFTFPGATVGAELQFFDFLSLELNFKAKMNQFEKEYYLDMGVGAQLGFPFKFFKLFVIQPYAAGFYPIRMFPFKQEDVIFTGYPKYFLGGGIQLSTKGGRNGAFFIDVNYMMAFSDVTRENTYETFPNPASFNYNPSFLGIGIGYKHGLINRPRKPFAATCPCGCKNTVQCECGCLIVPFSSESEVLEEPSPEPEEPAQPERPSRPVNRKIFYF